MNNRFKERYGDWALVTGATSGIGAELADQIAAKGLNVVLVARKETELHEHAVALEKKYGIDTKTISADLATDEGIETVKQLETDIGLLVAAAGIEVNGAFEKTPLEQEERLLFLNVMATFQLTHHFSRGMVNRGRGGILLLSSLMGHMPGPYFANYAASKAYVLNLGASLAAELRPKGVDVSVSSPGLTATPMVADNGVDWTKTPFTSMAPSGVAADALASLGKKLLAIPGRRNKMMALMAKLSPMSMSATMNEKMVRKAIDGSKI